MVTSEPILVSMVTYGWHPHRERERKRGGGEDVEVREEIKKLGEKELTVSRVERVEMQ